MSKLKRLGLGVILIIVFFIVLGQTPAKGEGRIITEDTTLDSVNIVEYDEPAITISGEDITLTLTGECNLQGDYGIYITPESNNITIAGDGNTVLTVKGLDGSAIGSKNFGNSFTITNFKTIQATGNGYNIAGIGWNNGTASAHLTLSNIQSMIAIGGRADAEHTGDLGTSTDEGGPAIGGAGKGAYTGNITIDNCTIAAYGGGKSAGIGGGVRTKDGTISISNSNITTYGGNSGAGIGTGRLNESTHVDINIADSNISAFGGIYGSGIGEGYNSHATFNPQNITITNSTIGARGGAGAAAIGGGYKGGGAGVGSAAVDPATTLENKVIKIIDSNVLAIGGQPSEVGKLEKTNVQETGTVVGQSSGAAIGAGGCGSNVQENAGTFITENSTIEAYACGDRFAIDGFVKYETDIAIANLRYSRGYSDVDSSVMWEDGTLFLDAMKQNVLEVGPRTVITPKGFSVLLDDGTYQYTDINGKTYIGRPIGFYSVAATVNIEGVKYNWNDSEERELFEDEIRVENGNYSPFGVWSAPTEDGYFFDHQIVLEKGHISWYDTMAFAGRYQPETVFASVQKIWDDNDYEGRPQSIMVQLQADGVNAGDPIELSAANNWSHTWPTLVKFNKQGSEIVYTVTEVDEIPEYIPSYKTEGRATIIANHRPEPEPTPEPEPEPTPEPTPESEPQENTPQITPTPSSTKPVETAKVTQSQLPQMGDITNEFAIFAMVTVAISLLLVGINTKKE